jgi:hypothetical protein
MIHHNASREVKVKWKTKREKKNKHGKDEGLDRHSFDHFRKPKAFRNSWNRFLRPEPAMTTSRAETPGSSAVVLVMSERASLTSVTA